MQFRVSADGMVYVIHGQNSREEALGHIGRITDPTLADGKTNLAKKFRIHQGLEPDTSPEEDTSWKAPLIEKKPRKKKGRK